MTLSRRNFLRLGGTTVAGAAVYGQLPLVDAAQLSWMPPATHATIAAHNPDLHLLNRISWGARPADVERIAQLGYDAYLDEQLDPAALPDPEGDAVVAQLPILTLPRTDLYRLKDREYRCAKALIEGMVLRAVHSRRQLLERAVDFWSDHFNATGEELTTEMVLYQRDAIRQHALGNFRDMLYATAKHPTMLVYLDNYLNIAEHPNENYARELLELHTLGVDGGYTEADVKNVARAFTGWHIHEGTRTGFYFSEEEHDHDPKVVLGHNFPAGRGIEDGLHVLNMVANHPSTAQFLSRKLCVRFVSDNPPQTLVDSTAAVWTQTQGEIKPVLRHIFTADEFKQSAGQKLRRPLEFFIGALRATGTVLPHFELMVDMLNILAQVPYSWLPPDGYPDTADAWLSTNGLLSRWNVAMYLTHFAYSDHEINAKTELYDRVGQPDTVGQLVDAVAAQVFGTPLPPDLNASFIAYIAEGSDPTTLVTRGLIGRKLASLYGLMLASPPYQWR